MLEQSTIWEKPGVPVYAVSAILREGTTGVGEGVWME